ncbi:nascent polypeptide-associated complex subunit alpha, muscle-specific form-like isoform X1 [Pomacea canaliculata]|uniref:nascent polypeptide-associated complex subunit alpha, muscle-specific form-like isoform X1 n=1 Tax=Pomacea canaliculata TaxID=400727 RepID=UPI000D733902|nr:nascent polypeptide-associated complex subunit alpha, muscle-specific form-like isoform X1 [Pomacea canaliculata]XP_025097571.1 nascent polypeptide-associated complex subunit alpha, muscle-specific form-like isoform X1 [Pomacea canaliculata]
MAGLSPVSASPSSPSNSVSSRQATPINRPSSSLPGSPRPFTIPMPPLIPAAEAFAPPHMPAWQISSSSSSSSSSLDEGDMAPIDLTKPDKRVPLQEPSPFAVHGGQVTGDRLCSPKRSDATMAGSGIQTQVPRRLASNEQIEKERGNGASKNYIEVLDHANRSTAPASIQGAPQSLSFPHHPHTVTMAQDSLTPHATAKASMCSLPLSAVQTPVSHEEAALRGPLSIRAVTSQQRPLLHASMTSPKIMSQNVVRLPQNVITPTLLESLQPGVNPHVIAAPQSIRSPLAAQHQNPPPFMPNAPSLNSVALYSRAPSASHTTLPNFLIDPKTGPDVSSLGSTQSLAKSDPIRASPLGGFLWHRPQVSEGLKGKGTDVHDNNTRGLCKPLERESLVQHADVSHRHANKDHESNVRSIAGAHHPASTSYGNRIIDAGACSTEEVDRTNEWRQNFISVLHQTRSSVPTSSHWSLNQWRLSPSLWMSSLRNNRKVILVVQLPSSRGAGGELNLSVHVPCPKKLC